MTDFIFLGSKITADGECSLGIKRHLLFGRQALTYLNSMLKNRDITLLTKVHTVKAMASPVVMYRCESWTIEKAEPLKNWHFQVVVLEKTLESPLGCKKKSNQLILSKSTLNIHWKDWCWSWSSNTLATWCKEPTHWKRSWCWERLREGEGSDRGRDG